MANGNNLIELEDILKNLQTEEGKAKAIALAVQKGITNDPKYTSQTFSDTDLNASAEHIKAAENAYLAQNYDEAILRYEQAGCFVAAAELSFRMGYADRGKIYRALQKMQEAG